MKPFRCMDLTCIDGKGVAVAPDGKILCAFCYMSGFKAEWLPAAFY